MSIHTQLIRGFVALPVTAVLIVAGLAMDPAARDEGLAPEGERLATVALPRTVDFHSMLPGALHIVRRVATPID